MLVSIYSQIKSLTEDFGMDFEALAQDIFNKECEVNKKEQELLLARTKLFDARAVLQSALCDLDGPAYDNVSISLKSHILICKWDGEVEYELTFFRRVS